MSNIPVGQQGGDRQQQQPEAQYSRRGGPQQQQQPDQRQQSQHQQQPEGQGQGQRPSQGQQQQRRGGGYGQVSSYRPPVASSSWDPFGSVIDPFGAMSLVDPFLDFVTPTDMPFAGGWGGYDTQSTDIAHTFPRHVGSRLMTNYDGDLIWRPSCDVFETNDNITVHCDLPGVDKNEVSVDVRGGDLYISGQHKSGDSYETATSRVRERRVGQFRKIVRLPPRDEVDTENIKATYNNGLLEVLIPKTAESKGRSITVE